MNLAAALLPLLPGGAGVIAFVGAGGKTSALFRLAQDLEGQGRRLLLTATTHLWDPRLECRAPLDLILRPELEAAPVPGAIPVPLPEATPGLTVLLARAAEPPGKLKGIHPSWIPALGAAWDLVLVEADGSKGLPVKAPAGHEPVLPPGTGLVVGVIGLDCLGRCLDGDTVHRPDRFSAVTGCALGARISWGHLAALVQHPHGLFKGAEGPRALLLNQADRAPRDLVARVQAAGLAVDRILIAALGRSEGVIVLDQGRVL